MQFFDFTKCYQILSRLGGQKKYWSMTCFELLVGYHDSPLGHKIAT